MRASRYEREGAAAEVLLIGDIDDPADPGPGEVAVRIRLAALNPTDVKARSGATPRPIDGFQVPGMDGVGEIIAVGDGVDSARIGERVWLYFAALGSRWGSNAEVCVLPAHRAMPLPAGASDELGACLGVPAMTAHEVLTANGPVGGSTVLVQGGTGAVGHFAVQLARWMGATVIATAGSDDKCRRAIDAGAHYAVNYRSPDALDQIRALGPVDAVTEVDLASNLGLDLQVIRSGGSITTYAATSREPEIHTRQLMIANARLQFFLMYTWPADRLQQAAEHINQAIGEGALTALPIDRFALSDAVRAHELVESGHGGKTVIDFALA